MTGEGGGDGDSESSSDEFEMTAHEADMQNLEDLTTDLKQMDEVFEMLAQVGLGL